MQAAQAAAPRHHKPRRVIYKSTALERTAPQLVAAASADIVSAQCSIQRASAAAERVRLTYKQKKDVNLGAAVDGDDDASNAKKYERRLKMNRQSAAASRVRREAYTKALEAELVIMERDYRDVSEKLQAALERNTELQKAQEVELIDDGTAQEIKEEDEEEPEIDQVEVGDADVDDISEQPLDLSDFDDLGFPPNAIHSFSAPPPKVEELYANPAFHDNPDVLESEVPNELPECFLHAPVENELFDKNDNDFL